MMSRTCASMSRATSTFYPIHINTAIFIAISRQADHCAWRLWDGQHQATTLVIRRSRLISMSSIKKSGVDGCYHLPTYMHLRSSGRAAQSTGAICGFYIQSCREICRKYIHMSIFKGPERADNRNIQLLAGEHRS